MRRSRILLLGFVTGVALTAAIVRRPAAPMPPPDGPPPSFAERELERTIARVDMTDVPFDRAVQDVRTLTRAEIAVDDKALEEDGFDRTTPMTMHGTDVLLWQMLDRISAAAPSHPLGFEIVNGRIVLTTESRLEAHRTARWYDVRDVLLSPTPIPTGPTYSLLAPPTDVQLAWEKDRAESLVRLIEDEIAPDSWRDNGGSIGSIGYLAGRLLVVQTWANHHAVQQALRELRRPLPLAPPVPEKRWSEIRKQWIVPGTEATLEAAIEKPIAEIDFHDIPFDDAIEELRQRSGANIRVSRGSLPANTSVSLHLRSVSLSTALDALFAEPIAGVAMGYTVNDGIVVISTREAAEKNVVTRMYDVRDLAPTGQASSEERLELLTRLIEDSVSPDTWKDNGGNVGYIRAWGGWLLVGQTWPNQARTARVLETLRRNGMRIGAPTPTTRAIR